MTIKLAQMGMGWPAIVRALMAADLALMAAELAAIAAVAAAVDAMMTAAIAYVPFWIGLVSAGRGPKDCGGGGR